MNRVNRLMAVLVLGVAASGPAFGQVSDKPGTPAAFARARQPFNELRKGLDRAKAKPPTPWLKSRDCEPGPVQAVLDVPGGWCEGIAADHQGNIYISDQVTFNVYRITPRGESSLFAHLYDMYNPDANYAGALGLTFSRTGDLWISMLNFLETSRHGIYRVRPDGSSELVVPMNPDEIFGPNGLTFDNKDDLYITECINGAIWKVAKDQSTATLWSAHDLLTTPSNGVFGASSLAYRNGAFFVVNTDRGTVLKVPKNQNGTAGEPIVLASGLDGPNGVTFDPMGDLYVSCSYGGQVVRIREDGTAELLIDKGLGNPTSLAIVNSRAEGLTAYFANFYSPVNGVPSLLKARLCSPQQQDPHPW